MTSQSPQEKSNADHGATEPRPEESLLELPHAFLSDPELLHLLSTAYGHELKQAITAVLNNAQAGVRSLRADSINCDELQEIFIDIISDNKHMVEIVRQMQRQFRSDDSVCGPVNLNDTVTEVVALIGSELLGRSVLTSVELEQELPPIEGHSIQLQKVLLQLVFNACDAMLENPQDERRLIVRTECSDGGFVKLSVIDNGSQMLPKNIERVFDSCLTTTGERTGLGLAISREIISTHNGRLWATSNETAGATFSFTIPANARPSAKAHAARDDDIQADKCP